MKNFYLHITKENDGSIKILSFDGVFAGTAFFTTKENFYEYCQKKSDEWIISGLGNYDGWSKEDRKIVSDKWLKVKDLQEGEYEYYFNLGDLKEVFCEEVEKLAKSMGIESYKLTII